MINVEEIFAKEYPRFLKYPALVRKPVLALLKRLLRQESINTFIDTHKEQNFAFIDAALDHLNISYLTDNRQIQNIPPVGKVIIVANHPLGAMDAFCLIKMISTIRRDKKVKIIAQKALSHFVNL